MLQVCVFKNKLKVVKAPQLKLSHQVLHTGISFGRSMCAGHRLRVSYLQMFRDRQQILHELKKTMDGSAQSRQWRCVVVAEQVTA